MLEDPERLRGQDTLYESAEYTEDEINNILLLIQHVDRRLKKGLENKKETLDVNKLKELLRDTWESQENEFREWLTRLIGEKFMLMHNQGYPTVAIFLSVIIEVEKILNAAQKRENDTQNIDLIP